MTRSTSRGFTMIETLVGVSVISLALAAIAGMLIHNLRIQKSQQMRMEAQANARICLSMIVQRLRSAGWDPMNAGIPVVVLDPDLTDDVSQIEIFADVDEDGATDGPDEQVTIRHAGGEIAWRRTNDASEPFAVLAVDISNDLDGDGTPEPMFVADSATAPTRITVQITARSPAVDPVTRDYIRYTAISEVVLRKAL